MKKIASGLIALTVFMPTVAFAGTTVIEGDEAKKMYESSKGKAHALAQKDKTFILRTPDGSETPAPKSFTVKAGEPIFLTNEEEKYVHNVYDNTDNSWVLKKQNPSEVAVITFSKAGEHKLRCAIHPKMKVTVNVQ